VRRGLCEVVARENERASESGLRGFFRERGKKGRESRYCTGAM